MPWEFFDRVYCITLEERPDRLAIARREFQAVELLDRVEFSTESLHPTDPEQGIYEAHMRCLARGVAEGAETILVFEDDAHFDRYSATHLERGIRFLRENPEAWDVFFLGSIHTGSRTVPGYPGVTKIRYRSLAHAYAVRRPFAEAIHILPWEMVSYDALLQEKNPRAYSLYPSIAFQNDTPSNNLTSEGCRKTDALRRKFGGLEFIQKLTEGYFRHHVKIQVTLLALTALALWFVFFRG